MCAEIKTPVLMIVYSCKYMYNAPRIRIIVLLKNDI